MRAVIQRVQRAAVSVNGVEVAKIEAGMLILLGVEVDDTEEQALWLADKLKRIRIFQDDSGRMGEPLKDRAILCVSQFTLYGDVKRGTRPSFTQAAPAEVAERLYSQVCDLLSAKRGIFGADMAVSLVNDGPVTLIVDTPKKRA